MEPYVHDYRQLDPDQIKTYFNDRAPKSSESRPPFDPANLPDSRKAVNKEKLLYPEDLAVVRYTSQKNKDVGVLLSNSAGSGKPSHTWIPDA